MMALRILLLPLALVSVAYAAQSSTLKTVTATAPKTSTPSTSSATATPTGACATIAVIHQGFFSGNSSASLADVPPVLPSLAHDCLTSVPLLKDNATALIDWYLPYLEFQTTLAWLKDPPASYQQPGVDLIGGLNTIRQQVQNGTFSNQYDFEAAVYYLLQQSHEGHLALSTVLFQTFLFQIPYQFLSLSSNGTELPAIFIEDDLLAAANDSTGSWQPSSVAKMNGQNTLDWLTAYAKKNVRALIEPHADWNFMFKNTGRDWGLAGGSSSSALRTTINYPGTDYLNLTFANGSTASTTIRGYSTRDLSGVTNGTSFYQLIATPENGTATTTTATPVTLPELGAPYPSPIIVQDGLGSTGFVSGYFLNDTGVAVLSITSFHMTGKDAQTFQSTITDFIQKCHEEKYEKLVIDLQGNGGGTVLLAYDLFKQLFPTYEPFAGNRFRATAALNTLGSTLASYSDQDTNPISPQNSIKADGTDFKDWTDFFGPVSSHNDQYTSTQRWNLSKITLDETVTSNGIVVSGYANQTITTPQHWAPSSIVMLTDGFCGSTCAVFAEQMKTEMGVKSIVVGGRPETGPMQAIAGTRGSLTYTTTEVATYIGTAKLINPSLNLSSLPSTVQAPIPLTPGVGVSFNIRDQVRKSDQATPLQMVYEAADCRVFYTKEMMVDYSVLWQWAADAVLGDGGVNSTMCVQGSTGLWSSGNVTDLVGAKNQSSSSSTTTGEGSGTSAGSALRSGSGLGVLVAGLVAAFVALV